ncbi:hypothetical protein AMATHDRAFT_58664 [Amanita thiersii Skay4041]|uniref:Uncharacterized protein n=1 Tax=Amanita thiersii Skay4041 TaxID=703135 RepID=A0A2A9NTH9_9AGAR|nr:hypothetical protein AMATHDRAFT_58664 [Amanita thiersii Skay4041]
MPDGRSWGTKGYTDSRACIRYASPTFKVTINTYQQLHTRYPSTHSTKQESIAHHLLVVNPPP